MEENNNYVEEVSRDLYDTLYDNDKVIEMPEEEGDTIVVKPKRRRKLSKRGIAIIISLIVIVLAIIGLVLYFLLFKKDKTDNSTKEPEKIILQEKNFSYEDGVLKIKNVTGNDIGEYECVNKDIESCYVAFLSDEDDNDLPKYQNEKGDQIQKRSSVYFDKYVFIYDENKVKLYNLKDNNVESEYELVKTPDSKLSYVIVKNADGKYGLLDIGSSSVETKLDFKYENLSMQNDENSVVYYDGKDSYLLNLAGEKITNQLKGVIKSYNSLYISLYNKNYALYDYKGTKLLSDLDYISFHEGYIITIKKGYIYVYDQDLTKLNEDGIEIKTKNYNVIYVFDSKDNFKESIKPFEIEAGENFVTITSEKELINKQLNVYEAIISKRYDYVSYLDGVIYVFSNKDKTNLIGKYVCKNPNVITAVDQDFDRCFIAKSTNIVNTYDENYFTPIFNGTYVLINDTNNTEVPMINIYDIKQGKLATGSATNYKNVDVITSDANIKNITSKNNVVISENSFGYFGVITLDGDGLNSIIRFNDTNNGGNTNSIKLLNNKYYVVNRDKNYLYALTGGEPITSSTNEIVDYAYNKLVVKSTYYMIYSGGSILSNDYVYVKLYDNYFVGITKDNKLNIYNYSNHGNLSSDLTVKVTSDYDKSYALEINKNEDEIVIGYTIKIYNTDNTFDTYNYNTEWGLL